MTLEEDPDKLRDEIKQLFDHRNWPERLKIIDCLSQGLTIQTLAKKDIWWDCAEIMMYKLYALGHSKRSIGREFNLDHSTVGVKIKKAEKMIRERFPWLIG